MDTREQAIRSLLGKQVHVEIDRPKGYLHGDILYPINYGYLPGTLAGDGEPQDAYILGISEPISSFDGRVIGAVCRRNDCEDKLVVAPEGMVFHQAQIAEAVHFQEQYFDSYVISLLRRSCGVLPYRKTGNTNEYLLVYEQFSQCWSLPKGHMEPGETEPQTALRELWEETGLTAVLDTGCSVTVEYSISPIVKKQMVLYPGLVSGTPRIRAGEIERFQWIKEDAFHDYLFPDTAQACKQLILQAKL